MRRADSSTLANTVPAVSMATVITKEGSVNVVDNEYRSLEAVRICARNVVDRDSDRYDRSVSYPMRGGIMAVANHSDR